MLEQLLRGGLSDQAGLTTPRRFSCLGTLSGEHDLAERSEDILREEIAPPDAESAPE